MVGASWRTSLTTIREGLEQRERETLAAQAAKSADTRGRLRPETEDDVRPAYQHDRDRILRLICAEVGVTRLSSLRYINPPDGS